MTETTIAPCDCACHSDGNADHCAECSVFERDATANVRVLRPATESLFRHRTTLTRSVFCMHALWTVDEGNRTVTCRGCGALLDPFEALVVVARDENWLRSIAVERVRLDRENALLRKDNAKLRAKARKAGP